MTRKEAIVILKHEKYHDIFVCTDWRKKIHEALEMAISSLETDEAYQLEYEKPECKAEDCISREYLKQSMIEYGWKHPDSTVTEYVDSLPSVYPKSDKPTGEWVPNPKADEPGNGELMCSNCKNEDGEDLYYKYCPNCGARMVDPQESEDV